MLYVCPNVLGRGVHLFSELSERITLKLERTMSFSSGVKLRHYAPVYD